MLIDMVIAYQLTKNEVSSPKITDELPNNYFHEKKNQMLPHFFFTKTFKPPGN